jgi:hypothetical protein
MTSFTLAVIPEANTVKDSCGLPFGCIVRPLVPIMEPGPERIIPAKFTEISRCESCGAYVSPFCRFEQRMWRCAMCGQTHDLTTRYSLPFSSPLTFMHSSPRARFPLLLMRISSLLPFLRNIRYRVHASRTQFIELSRLTYDVVQSSQIVPAGRLRPLVYVCAIDVTCSSDHIELVKSALLAMLEGLPQHASVMILTFAHDVSIVDMRESVPHFLHVSIGSDGFCDVALSDVLPVVDMAVPVATHRDCIAAAINSLIPSSFTNPHTQLSSDASHRSFGPAIAAIMQLQVLSLLSRHNSSRLTPSLSSPLPFFASASFLFFTALPTMVSETHPLNPLLRTTKNSRKDSFCGVRLLMFLPSALLTLALKRSNASPATATAAL